MRESNRWLLEEKKSPFPALIVTAIVVGSVSGGLYWWKHRSDVVVDPQPTPTAAAPVAAAPTAMAAPDKPAAVETGLSAAPSPSPTMAAQAPAAVAMAADDEKGIKSFTVTIHGALESVISEQVGRQVGTPLTQVVNRALVWWLKVPKDLVKGDTLSVAYETRPHMEPLVHAVRYESRKMGRTFEAYRFQAEGEKYAHFYAPDGVQLEMQLVDGPLEEWEQITSLLKDGRKHKGVDFKAPVGTPVKATFDGVVTRKNWALGSNGNSIEIEETGGKRRRAMYLHLSDLPKTLTAGTVVKRGEVIAMSGNTGHSFAPHLHYQMFDSGGNLLDPFDSHGTTQATCPMQQKPQLDRAVANLSRLLSHETVAGSR